MKHFQDSAITVSPEKIRQTALRAMTICESLVTRLESIESCVAKSNRVWSSDSAELLFAFFDEDKNEYESVKKSIRSKIAALEEIAAIYGKAEKEAAGSAEALPNSIIE